MVNCHCTLCRSLTGSAFTTYAVVRQGDVSVQGQSDVRKYQATEAATRHFCTKCGTPLFNTNPSMYPGVLMLYLGTIAASDRMPPPVNIFCADMLDWVASLTTLKSFPGVPGQGAGA